MPAVFLIMHGNSIEFPFCAGQTRRVLSRRLLNVRRTCVDEKTKPTQSQEANK